MIKVDKEFESLIPPLSEDEFRQLEENCVKEGIRDALVVWKVPNGDQILVDGHNRWKISAKHGGIPFQIKEMKFDLREDAIAWIIRNQFGRRNLSPYHRGLLALRLEPIAKAEAKKRQGTRTDKGNIVQNSARSRDEVAKVAGVSHDTIRKIKAIEESDRNDVKEACKSGDISINQGYREIIMQKLPKNPIREMERQAEERHEEFDPSAKTVSFDDIRQDKEDRVTIGRRAYIEICNSVKSLDAYALIKTESVKAIPDALEKTKLEHFRMMLMRASGDITKILMLMEEK